MNAMKVHFSFQIVAGIMETDPEAQGSGRVKSEVILIMEFFLAVQNSSIVDKALVPASDVSVSSRK